MNSKARHSLQRDIERIHKNGCGGPIGRPVLEGTRKAKKKSYSSVVMQEFVPKGCVKEVIPVQRAYSEQTLTFDYRELKGGTLPRLLWVK